ncbi:uncharacterized protein PV07_11287 [Cladophialophora immunda]|uniref:VOC domain-containing protein n=1 Tax=Cladophialophora immunda TaxID=569365 RepID=A0A0D2BXL5_9EURO|nr:uncharacterized protein PV07_11287 [Cladophialophora immunda]KIW23055.1 hypothetical protein PV07_11287 [Cladophialophora immunda]OQU93637.1 hypothetical protein CLAIMM_00119 [Cladophialophora immunda]
MSVDREENPADIIFDIYPKELRKAKIAVMTAGNGVGVEFFEFIDPKMTQAAAFDITRGGVFHVAVTDPHPEELCSKIIAAGGKKIGKPVSPFPLSVDGFKDGALYLQDPWGNTIEIVSCNLELLLANRS